MKTLVHVAEARITTPYGRLLFDGLKLQLSREHVALIGRNGVGKSSLLEVLAGVADVQSGRVKLGGKVRWVPQRLATRSTAMSDGEQRKRALAEALASEAEILLLDEPTSDLDDDAVAWLRKALKAWPACLVVASHDRRLLGDFEHFLLASESGCRAYSGTLQGVELQLEHDAHEAEERYARHLQRLVSEEERIEHIAQRRDRKKRRGRCSELDRATSPMRLNTKRSRAQVYQGRMKQQREAQIDSLRQWTKATRRALNVHLDLQLPLPTLPEPGAENLVVLQGATVHAGGRSLFAPLDLRVGRQRMAVVGPNASGKTTLLEVMLGRRSPTEGKAYRDLARIGSIAQGGTDWLLEESLLSYLALQTIHRTEDELARSLVAHRFPLALAKRPLRSLSPGERARAALIALFHRTPSVELLVLDEPTFSLDLVGQRAMTEALCAWPGGLVVASHDRDFLHAIGVETVIELHAHSS